MITAKSLNPGLGLSLLSAPMQYYGFNINFCDPSIFFVAGVGLNFGVKAIVFKSSAMYTLSFYQVFGLDC